MTRREHAPYTHRHKLGWWIVAFLAGAVLWAVLILLGMTAAKALG